MLKNGSQTDLGSSELYTKYFEDFRAELDENPLLSVAKSDRRYISYTDASYYAVGSTIIQKRIGKTRKSGSR